jgi:hypothetical protein
MSKRQRLQIKCDACSGNGTVAREKGKTTGDVEDANAIAYLWPKLCEKCCGSGLIDAPGPGENG